MTSQENPKPPIKKIPFWKRKFLIDPAGQLITTAKVAALVLLLLILLNIVFQMLMTSHTSQVISRSPEFAAELHETDIRAAWIFAALSAITFVLVIIRSIMLTHRTAGAAFNINRCISQVAAGDYTTTLRVRAKDNLRGLQEPFNEMTAALRLRAGEDRDTLVRIADEIDKLGNSALAEEVRKLADAKGQMAD
jgi:methyl-accepting chemotaxis protein